MKGSGCVLMWLYSKDHSQTGRQHQFMIMTPPCMIVYWVPGEARLLKFDNSYLELDIISGQGSVVVHPVGGDEALGESLLQVRAQPVLVDVGQQTNHTLSYKDDHQQDCELKYYLNQIFFLVLWTPTPTQARRCLLSKAMAV